MTINTGGTDWQPSPKPIPSATDKRISTSRSLLTDPITTTTQLDKAIEKAAQAALLDGKTAPKQIWLGNNLLLCYSKGKPAYFKLLRRVTFGDQSKNLGLYGKVTFEDVLKQAEVHNAEAKVVLEEEKTARLLERQKARAAEPKEKSFKSQTGFSSKVEFLEYIDKVRTCNYNSDLELEIKTYLELCNLMPHRSDELLNAYTTDFHLERSIWYIQKKSIDNANSNELLANQCKIILNTYFLNIRAFRTGNYNITYQFRTLLFTTLNSLTKEDRILAFSSFISNLSFKFKYDSDRTLNTFLYLINEASVYNDSFVSKFYVKKNATVNQQSYYAKQRWALNQWWENNIYATNYRFDPNSDMVHINQNTSYAVYMPFLKSPFSDFQQFQENGKTLTYHAPPPMIVYS